MHEADGAGWSATVALAVAHATDPAVQERRAASLHTRISLLDLQDTGARRPSGSRYPGGVRTNLIIC